MVPWRWAVPQEAELEAKYLLVRCERCGTASTAGPPPAERDELYETGTYEATAVRGERLVEAVRALYERQKLAILRSAGVSPPARVVDVGAGQGRFVLAARRRGYDAVGFEPSRRGVEIAARRGVSLQAASLADAELDPSGAGAVSCWHVLEHLDDPPAALERIADWLRPDGALLLGVPNLDSLQAGIAGGRWLHLDVPRHRHHFTPRGARALLESGGFNVAAVHQVLVEHNLFGMWQSWLDRFASVPAYAYNLVKRNVEPNPRDLAITAGIGALAPAAAVLELIAGLAGRGGTMAIVARRR
jgi:SAM-dependent methyltransferase